MTLQQTGKLPAKFLTRNGRKGPFHGTDKCTRCGKKIVAGASVWLELDQRTDEYHDFGGVPADKSQGAFEFGPNCAAVLRNRAALATKERS